MNTPIYSEPPIDQLPESSGEIARRAADAVKETAQKSTAAAKDTTGEIGKVANEVTDATKDAAIYATGKAKDMYHSAALTAEDALETSKEYPPALFLFGTAKLCEFLQEQELAKRTPGVTHSARGTSNRPIRQTDA